MISLTQLETTDDEAIWSEARPVLLEIAKATVSLEAAKRTAARTRARLTDETSSDDSVYAAIERDDRALFRCLDAYNTALRKVIP